MTGSDAARRTAPAAAPTPAPPIATTTSSTPATTTLVTPPAKSTKYEPEMKRRATSTPPRQFTQAKAVPTPLSEPNPPISTSTSTFAPISTSIPQPRQQPRQQQAQESPQDQPPSAVPPTEQRRPPQHPTPRQPGYSQPPPAPAPGSQFHRFATNQNQPHQLYHPRHQQPHHQQHSQHQPPSLPPLPPLFEPYPIPGANREQFYSILGDLDPYKATPKEFIHLLVNAAIRDGEIAKALFLLNSDRINNPDIWQPPAPPNFAAQPHPPRTPNQPTPGTFTPTLESSNTHTHTRTASQPTSFVPSSAPSATPLATLTGALPGPPALPPTRQDATSHTTPRKRRRRDEGARKQTAATPTTSQLGTKPDLRMVMYWGPQQPLPPVNDTAPQY